MKYCIFSLFLLLLSSCNNSTFNTYKDGKTMFVVKNITNHSSLKKHSIYEVEVVDVNGLSWMFGSEQSRNLEFSFTDSINKFVIGQPIKFEKIK